MPRTPFKKRKSELSNAQNLRASKADRSAIAMAAREAAETAEDARAIAMKHKQDAEIAAANNKAAQEQSRRVAAEAEAQRLARGSIG